MVRINYTRYNDGSGRAVLDLQVSTVAELPALNEELGMRLIVGAGSIAQVIQTGAWYTLDDNGTWYDATGTPASSASNNSLNASLSAPKTSAQLGEGKSVLVQDEPEINLDGEFEREIEQHVKEQKKAFEESIEEPEEKDGEDDDELL